MQNEIKQEIRNLIDKYNKVVEEKRVSKYNEEMTKKDFILPLFRALGWNTEDSSEVTAEEKISKKRVDYGFRINGIPKFFLEAKSLREDLNNDEFIKQAINYAWLKGCTWAILTNFENVKIFNAEWKTSNPSQSHLKTISCQEFLDRFEELWLLSKESFEKGLLDKEAEKWGKKTKKTPVDKQLLADFTRFRELLSKNITKLNQSKNLTEEELDESVQRILDRLIFIRYCEDKGLEANTLISNKREWENKGKGQLIESLREVFANFDKQYNSKIFANHLCDRLDIDNEVLNKIIEGLYYTKDKSLSYDFSAIEADVLGNIYEQYLGHILKKSEKRAKLKKSHAHRKEQGIYYTPTYIVDYIVRNTLGELIKNKKPEEVEKIRVLDPACGSGSFLIKAFDVLNEYYAKYDKDYSQTQMDFNTGLPFTSKVKILKNNIFGVDLDKQAVDIAQLNLLIKIAEKEQRLPLLQENIKCGNSLIDDPAIAGDKAFKWEEEFKEVMKKGGFDVVVGNPPWVSIKGKQKSIDLSDKELDYLLQKYRCDTYRPNLFEMFIWRGLSLVKEGGYFGFIVPDRLCYNGQFTNIRKYILENFTLKKLWFKPIFEEVISDNVIFIIKKEKPTLKSNVEVAEYPSNEFRKIPQKVYSNLSDFSWFIVDEKILNIFDRIKNKDECFELSKKFQTNVGFIAKSNKLTKNQQNSKQIKVFKGENITRFGVKGGYYFEFRKENLAGGTQDINKLSKKNKVFLRKTGIDVIATFDNSGTYPEQSVYFVYTEDDKNESELKSICVLLNSKLLNCYYKNFAVTNRDATPQLKKVDLDKFPIILPTNLNPLIELADKMLSLNKRLNEIGDKKTDERAKIEEEIRKTDAEIDEFVYKIYGITEEEKKIIEESFK